MSDGELRKLLEAIHRLALVPYPFPEGEHHNPRFLMALGEIAGLSMRAIRESSE